MERPTSVTIIAWIIIVLSVLGALFTPMSMGSPEMTAALAQSAMPPSFHMAFLYIQCLLSVVCGIGMLKARNWGRVGYMVLSMVAVIVGLATSPFPVTALLGLVFPIIFAFFLFRKPANDYFGKRYFGEA